MNTSPSQRYICFYFRKPLVFFSIYSDTNYIFQTIRLYGVCCVCIDSQTDCRRQLGFFFLSSFFHRHDVCVFEIISYQMHPSWEYISSSSFSLSLPTLPAERCSTMDSFAFIKNLLIWFSDIVFYEVTGWLAESFAANAIEEQMAINEFVGTVVFSKWMNNEKGTLIHSAPTFFSFAWVTLISWKCEFSAPK